MKRKVIIGLAIAAFAVILYYRKRNEAVLLTGLGGIAMATV